MGNNPINFVDPLGLFATGQSGGSNGGFGRLDALQAGLDTASLGLDATGVGGLVSFAPDLANAGISLGRGDFAGAGLSALAAVPFLGAPANAIRLGRAGEQAAGILKNTARIPSLSGTANFRVPDVLNRAQRIIGEVKNVARLSFTRQLRDFSAFAKARGFTFELTVRAGDGTRLSRPWQQAVDSGDIVLSKLP